jgi:hypothetical protein
LLPGQYQSKIVAMNARSDAKQGIFTTLALLIPVAIFIVAAPTNSFGINSLNPSPPIPRCVVKIVASDWIDYLQVAKFNGDWKIINVLWELKPK